MDRYTVEIVEGRPSVVLEGDERSLLVAHVDHLSPWGAGHRHDPARAVPLPQPGDEVAVEWDAESEGNWIWVEVDGGRYSASVDLYLVRAPGQTDADAVESAGLDEINLLPHPYGRSL